MQLADLTWCFPLAASYPPHPFLLVQESVSPFQTGVAFLSVDAPKTGNLRPIFRVVPGSAIPQLPSTQKSPYAGEPILGWHIPVPITTMVLSALG